MPTLSWAGGLLAVVASLNDWKFQGYLYKMVLFFGGAMKAFLSFKVGEGNGVVLVAHLSRPLF